MAKDIGEFFVLKWYTLYFCFTCEVMMISQITNIIFMIFGGAAPPRVECMDPPHFNDTVNQMGPKSSYFDALMDNTSTTAEACEIFKDMEKEHYSCVPHFPDFFTSVNAEFAVICGKEWLVKMSTAVQMVGLMVGNIIFGHVSDSIGRRKTLFIGNAGLAVSCFVSSFAVEMVTFTAGRALVMVFTACTYSVTNVFMAENLPPKHRMWLMTIITYSPNYAFVSLIAYLCGDWRWMSRVVAVISLIPLGMLVVLYESPRWMMRKGLFDQSEDAILAVGRWDNTNTDQKKKVLASTVQRERKRAERTLEKGKTEKKYNVTHLFSHRDVAIYTTFFSYSFCVTSLVYYGIMFNMQKLSGNMYLNTIMVGGIRYLLNIICAILDIQFAQVGRRLLHFLCMGLMTVGLLAIFSINVAQIDIKQAESYVILTVASFCSEIFILDNIASTELLPTPVRNIGVSFIQVWNSIGHIIAAPLFKFMFEVTNGLPYVVAGALCGLDVVLLLIFIPETKNASMPERTTRTTGSLSSIQQKSEAEDVSMESWKSGQLLNSEETQKSDSEPIPAGKENTGEANPTGKADVKVEEGKKEDEKGG